MSQTNSSTNVDATKSGGPTESGQEHHAEAVDGPLEHWSELLMEALPALGAGCPSSVPRENLPFTLEDLILRAKVDKVKILIFRDREGKPEVVVEEVAAVDFWLSVLKPISDARLPLPAWYTRPRNRKVRQRLQRLTAAYLARTRTKPTDLTGINP